MYINTFRYINKHNILCRNKNNNDLNITTPLKKTVSFSSQLNDDKKLAKKYYDNFVTIVALEGTDGQKNTKQKLKDFFQRIKNESLEVQKEFLKININNADSVFEQSLCLKSYEPTKIIIKMYETIDERTRAAFLVPKKSETLSPFCSAISVDKNLQLSHLLKEMVKSLSVTNQARFYFGKVSDDVANQSLIDYLRNWGYAEFAAELDEDRKIFEKNNPLVAHKYKSINKTIDTKTQKQDDNQKISVAPKKDDDNSSTFRVYEKVKTRFSDVGGMFNVKKQIQNELLNIINNPRVKNSDKPSGIILYGPPGTGKTLLATAIAGEAGVPFISTAGSGFNERFVGMGAKRVRDLYAEARNLAHNSASKTAIVFIDEADAVAGKRNQSSNRENDHTLNALLSELDGVQSKEENDIKIITILATNRKDMFDEAFRKGRIDLEFKIDDPRLSEKARREILMISAKDKPFESEVEKERILSNLAQTSSGMSGAELADVIKRAYRKTLYIGRKIFHITEKDINEAKLEALLGIKNDSEESEYEQKATIAHEAGHAINQLIMNRIYANENEKSKLPIQKVDFIVNESRGDAAGVTMMKPSPDNHRLTVESLISYLVVGYGGYSIEEEMFDGHTDGVSSDLNSNTNLILNSVTKWGLGSKTKFIGCSTDGISYELFKSDIKQDIIDYSNVAMTISSKISAFAKPFIDNYLNIFIKSDADKVNIITGESFEKMFDKWLKENGNFDEYQKLCQEIRNTVKEFKTKIRS